MKKVYNISVLANIPISALDLLEPSAVPLQRIRPLFTVGVNDITFLLEDLAASKRAARDAEAASSGGSSPFATSDSANHEYSGSGWIACTTDSILAVKAELWDVLITMPHSRQATSPTSTGKDRKVWPTVEIAKGVPLKATQRDLRRYKALKAGLERLAGRTFGAPGEDGGAGEQCAWSGSKHGAGGKFFSQDDAQLMEAAESVVEPVTWSALAYNGFMWWASAGEQSRSEETDESIHDTQLLADIVPSRSLHPLSDAHTASSSNLLDSITSLTARRETPGACGEDDDNDEEEERANLELAIITYFHRLTTHMLSVLSDVVESSDEDDDDGYYYDDNERDDGFDHYYDDEDVAGTSAAANGVGSDSAVGRTGRASNEDSLVGARRSGLAPSGSAGGAASSVTTALLLRRRSGRSRLASESSSSSSRRLRHRSSNGHPSGTHAGSTIRINSNAVSRMGLDVWSQADAQFVRDVARQYFGRRGHRRVYVESKGVEVCGFKVC